MSEYEEAKKADFRLKLAEEYDIKAENEFIGFCGIHKGKLIDEFRKKLKGEYGIGFERI